MVRDMKIQSYNEYMNILQGRGDIYVFRGQANKDFVLIPSGLRDEHIKHADKEMFLFVDEMNKKFGFDELTCIEIAQHFFLPTRMLDFSYSYLVALFFACHDNKGKYDDCDGKVFVFNKSKYERILKEKNKLSSHVIKNNKYLYEWLERYLNKENTSLKDDIIDLPIFIDATEEFDRLHMQKGLFLLWGKDKLSLEDILENEGINYSDVIDEIIIDKDYKKSILKELEKLHINEDTIYMNVASIKELVTYIKSRR